MARPADFGLMVLDGASPSTCLNILRLATIGSPCAVCDMMRGSVAAVQNVANWGAMFDNPAPRFAAPSRRMTPDERLRLAE